MDRSSYTCKYPHLFAPIRLGDTLFRNRYFAAPKPGEMPGDLTLGPIGSTQMACPEPVASFERRFLTQLGSVRKFGFVTGLLALSYEKDGAPGVMLFEAR